MKFIHLSDLHLGKRVQEYSMIDDQQHILSEILRICDEQKPDAVLIAGDVYDRSIPSEEAVQLFDTFLRGLAARSLQVCIISGNHDSEQRVAFGASLMTGCGVHIAPVYRGELTRVAVGDTDVYMLPFVKPAVVRACFPDRRDEINDYTDAVRVALEGVDFSDGRRKILMAHQFITGAEISESEERTIGGLDNVSAEVLKGFDYVALGHLHKPQDVRANIRYCGSPLKYSISEEHNEKSVTVVTLDDALKIETVPLAPLHELRTVRGTFAQITGPDSPDAGSRDDYVRVQLTDEDDVPQAMSRLRLTYPNLFKLEYDNTRTNTESGTIAAVAERQPMEYFAALFEAQNGRVMTDEQRGYLQGVMEKIWEGRE